MKKITLITFLLIATHSFSFAAAPTPGVQLKKSVSSRSTTRSTRKNPTVLGKIIRGLVALKIMEHNAVESPQAPAPQALSKSALSRVFKEFEDADQKIAWQASIASERSSASILHSARTTAATKTPSPQLKSSHPHAIDLDEESVLTEVATNEAMQACTVLRNALCANGFQNTYFSVEPQGTGIALSFKCLPATLTRVHAANIAETISNIDTDTMIACTSTDLIQPLQLSINLSSCALTEIPAWLSHAHTNITKLNLAHNPLQKLSISRLPRSLQALNVSDCCLTYLPANINSLDKLLFFHCSNNPGLILEDEQRLFIGSLNQPTATPDNCFQFE
jgi:hypothetical protein